MTYPETIDYLFYKLPMFSRIGSAAFKKDLTNIKILCNRLGHPEEKFPSIHVGGTNGKGSVSHMLSAVYQQQGYKTGLYTSPHLYDFRERIRVDGEMVSEAYVVDFVQRIKPFIEEIEPSFFEITVAMAFEFFAINKVDVAIIEVGLGGRLDSTNIILPIVSVITNIGLDHMNMLGDSLPAIAFEKAGIVKQNIPVVIGERHPETENVFTDAAEEKQAPVYFAEDHFKVINYEWKDDYFKVTLSSGHEEKTYHLDLPGIYQAKNLCTVLQTLKLTGTFLPIDDKNVDHALTKVKSLTGLRGRWEVVQQHPMIILEVSHNEPGIKEVLHQLKHIEYHQLHIIFGMVKDKDPGLILKMMPQMAQYYWTQAHIPRALDANSLKAFAYTHSLHGDVYPDVNKALLAAKEAAGENDIILVCGSIFLVAEMDRNLVNTSSLPVP